MVSFTGSTRAGREVDAVAGGLLKRLSLELGGNNAYIVLDDADIERAADAAGGRPDGRVQEGVSHLAAPPAS